MKRLQAWMRVRSLRQVHIWWHWKHAEPGPNQFNVPVGAEIYWHVELKDFEPLEDHGQRQQRGSWSKTEHVYTGYDHDLNRAITKALRVARDSPGVKDAEYEMNIE